MTEVKSQDISIEVDVPQRDGSIEKLYLTEFDNVKDVVPLASVSKRVVLADTADLIFRLFAKARTGDVNLKVLSKRIPCLGKAYFTGLRSFFEQTGHLDIIREYNACTDNKKRREIRKRISPMLIDYISKNIKPKDLQYNYTKFKFEEENLSARDKIKKLFRKVTAKMLGLDSNDPFVMASYQVWADCWSTRSVSDKRKAYWMLIRNADDKILGMICISSRQLEDKLTGQKIIGHSGYILDPSLQGRGYISALDPVMIEYMYDNMDAEIANNALFATTCDEFNENSQGVQKKHGAWVLRDEKGNVVVRSGKMHWYATKEDVLNSEIMKKAAEQGVKYTVSYVDDRQGYTKTVGNDERIPTVKKQQRWVEHDR